MKRWIVAVVIVVGAAAVTATIAVRRDPSAPTYRFVKVERGRIDSVVSATGTLSAVTTVQVGTQVSGLISKLLVDFNGKVEKGQVIAQLDTTLLESNLLDAEATLERAQADLLQADRDLQRLTALNEQGITAVADFNKAQYSHDVASASVKSAQASLSRARQNLAYATITAPISGTVVERDVDVGQTVAASLATPKLFVIANDLSEMQILAPVAESDIGEIKEGQTARFTVKPYPERRFTGIVKQVRLQSAIDQNIVNYTVVISVKNPDGKLLPGMTATVDFLVASAEDVLKVANAALRFRPPEAVLAGVRARMQKELAARGAGTGEGDGAIEGAGDRSDGGGPPAKPGDSSRLMAGGFPGGGMLGDGFPGSMPSRKRGADGTNGGEPQMAMLYYLKDGKLAMLPVRPGITDGQFTEVHGPFLADGMQVIAGMTQTASTAAATTNPFQASQSSRPPGPPPPGGF